jgi:hypothetical protein
LKLFRKIVSFFLIGIILSFSGGLHIGKHLCNGDVVSRAINHEVDVCKKAKDAAILSCDIATISLKSCCETELDFFHSDSFSKTLSLSAVYLPVAAIIIPEPALSSFQSMVPDVQDIQNIKGPPLFKLMESYLI